VLRFLVAVAEAHLRDDAEHGVAAGLAPRQAELEAVSRFGPAARVVAAEHRRLATPLSTVLRAGAASAVLLGSIAAIAVGVSGLIAEVIRLVGGARVLVDVAPGRTLSAPDCTRWLNLDSGAANCRDAAVADWVNEVVGYRIVAGLLGAVALAGYFLVRRRWQPRQQWTTLPPAVSDTIAVTLFGAAGVWTLAMGLDAVVTASGRGSGQWLSAAPVALTAAAVFGIRLVRDVDLATTSP
jgi:hypothetical protein